MLVESNSDVPVSYQVLDQIAESRQLKSMLGTGLMQTYSSLILSCGGSNLKWRFCDRNSEEGAEEADGFANMVRLVGHPYQPDQNKFAFHENFRGKARNTDRGLMRMAEATMHELEGRGLKVQSLNITQLSDGGRDAHPSICRMHWVPSSKVQLADPRSYSDCVHWCLPRVPDVWNEILYPI